MYYYIGTEATNRSEIIMKTMSSKTTKSGNKVALVIMNNGGFLVYIQKCNYSQGKNVYKWFPCMLTQKQKNNDFQLMVKAGLTEMEATRLYNKKK